MAALFDTTVGVLLLRRNPPEETEGLIRAARVEIAGGGALLPAIAVSELFVGERTVHGLDKLAAKLSKVPSLMLPDEAARDAGLMGAFLRMAGAPVPLPDLLIAATALWLEVPLLAWDGDYARSCQVARECGIDHPGADLWRRLRLHPESRKP